MSAGTKGQAGADYVVERTSPEELTEAELLRCAAIVRAGCAVRKGFETKGLKQAQVLAVARRDGEIVGVGAIKRAGLTRAPLRRMPDTRWTRLSPCGRLIFVVAMP